MKEKTYRGINLGMLGLILVLVMALVAVQFGVGTGPGDEFEAQGIPKTRIAWAVVDKMTLGEGGAEFRSLVDIDGNCLDLDADADTSLCADTDDQIDHELGGVDTIVEKAFPTSTGTGATVTSNIVEVQGSSPAWITGTNTLNLFDLDLSVGDANTGTHAINGIMIDGITGDAQVTESAINLGAGWDTGIDANGLKIDLDADADTSITADTDDQIDIEISGADDFQFTANTFTAQSGSSIVLASGAYPLGYASSGQQLVYGTASITGTAEASHGLTTVTFALCTLGEDPTAGAGEAAMCTVAVSGNTVTVKVWQDDFVTEATETEVDVHWLVVGTP